MQTPHLPWNAIGGPSYVLLNDGYFRSARWLGVRNTGGFNVGHTVFLQGNTGIWNKVVSLKDVPF